MLAKFQQYRGTVVYNGWKYDVYVVFRGEKEPENLYAMYVVAKDGTQLRPHEALYQRIEKYVLDGDATLRHTGNGLPDWARTV